MKLINFPFSLFFLTIGKIIILILPFNLVNFLLIQNFPELCITGKIGIFVILCIAKNPEFILADLLGIILVPSGKIINFVLPFLISLSTDLVIVLIEFKPLSLFIKIKPNLLKYLENIGICFNSSFNINTEPLNNAVKKKVSHAD